MTTRAPQGKCDECTLKSNVFVPSELHIKSKILGLAEAPGYHEAQDGRPLVGVAGQDMNRIIEGLGYKREDVNLMNAVACLTKDNYAVFTSQGWRQLRRIKVGDLVLTHSGNFKRVLSKVEFTRNERDIHYGVKTDAGRTFVSSDHRFLTKDGWKFVTQLRVGDEIQVLGSECPICHSIYYDYDNTCSPACEGISRSIRNKERNKKGQTAETREKIKQSMLNQYQTGVRNPQEITKKAHEAYKIQGATGLGELDLKELLDTWGFINKHHAPVDRWQVDFLVDNNIVVEVWTGGLTEWQEIEEKRKCLEPMGYIVLDYNFSIVYRYPDLIRTELTNIKKNHNKEFRFMLLPITEIKKGAPVYKTKLYSLEIEGDESFVAQRLVHHNCRPTKIEDGKTFNRTPTDNEIAWCNARMIAEIEALSPTVIVCMGKVACYDTETEVLTKDGWKFWDKVNKETKLATVGKDGYLKWQTPIRLFEYLYKGKMWSVDTTYVNLLVTPNHTLYVNTKEASNDKHDFSFKQINEVSSMWRFKVLSQVDYDGDEVSTFTIPSHETISYSGKNHLIRRIYRSEALTVEMDDWLEFLGYYLTEGCKMPTATLTQSKKVHPKVWQQMRNCVNRMGLKWSESKDDGRKLYVRHMGLREYVKQFGYSKDRFIPREFMNLSLRQLNILLNALMAGDGNQTWSTGDRGVFASCSTRLKNDVQELALKCGYGSIIGKYNHVYIRRKSRGMMPVIKKNQQKWVDYDGMVYCAEVTEHLLLVRRKGRVAWCSNSIALGSDKSTPMNQVVGTKFTWRDRFDVIVTYHPAAIAHSGGATTQRGKMIRDNIEQAFKLAFEIKPQPKQLRML